MEFPKYVPKSDIEILSQEIDDVEGFYRVRAGHRIHYLHIPATVFEEDTLCMPHLLIPALPKLPDHSWNKMDIARVEDGSLTSEILYDALPGVQEVWHPQRVEFVSLKYIDRHREGVREMLLNGQLIVAKFARWEWEICRMENETRAYAIINEYQQQHPEEPPIAPKFLGHIMEDGRVTGIMLEKIKGRFASIDDLVKCEEIVRKLHGLGLIHGDINRYNFILDQSGSHVRMLDFEHIEDYEEEVAELELEVLPSELQEETGRGGPSRVRPLPDQSTDSAVSAGARRAVDCRAE
jgi:hypothetical protein